MIRDLRYAFRTLTRERGFTLAAVLTLALGLGANAIVYGIVSGLILRPLPFGDRGGRLVTLHSTHPTQAQDWDDSDVSYADLLDVRERSQTLVAVEGVLNRNFSLNAGDRTERLLGASVTPGLFALLGVVPQVGRDFREDDGAEPGLEGVVIISHRLWERLYQGDAGIVGRAVPVNGRAVTVIGVMPPQFAFPENHDVWLPYKSRPDAFRNRRNLLGVGLLGPGRSLAEARAELSALASDLAAGYPETNRNWGLHALALRDLFVPDATRAGLTAMLLAVGFVLLVACANVAGLLVARGVGRSRELSVRAALGANRFRLVRLLLVESLILALAGGMLGAIVASWGLDALVASMPEPPVYWARIGIDEGVLIYTFALALVTAGACGLLPALRLGGHAGFGALQSSRASSLDPTQRRVQGVLVAGQVALSLVLLVAATLLARSATMLQQADIGFDAASLLSLRVYVAGDAYDDPAARARAVETIANRLSALPGVRSAAAVGAIPGDDGGASVQLLPPRQLTGPDARIGAHSVPVTAAVFETLGLALVEGRTFTASEMEGDTDAVIVNRRLAQQFWPGSAAVGRELRVADGTDIVSLRIVGVAPDIVYEEPGEETLQSRLTLYVPYVRAGWRTMAFLVRGAADPETLAGASRRAVVSVDSSFAAYDVMSMNRRRSVTSWGERILGRTFSLFALAAVFLACLGVYGLTAHAAAQRTREIGIRLAIGATRHDIVRLFLGGGLRLAVLGALAGLPLAVAAAKMIEGLLFRVSPWMAAVWAGVPVALLAAVLLASLLPARRASLTDPATALRHD